MTEQRRGMNPFSVGGRRRSAGAAVLCVAALLALTAGGGPRGQPQTRGSRRGVLSAQRSPADRPVLFETMLKKIADRYYDPKRLRYPEFVAAALQAMEPEVPELLVDRTAGDEISLTVGSEKLTVATQDANSIDDVGRKLHEALLFVLRATGRRTDNMKLQRTMFAAILETLDPYCRFFHPRVFVRLKESLKGYTVGVGAQISRTAGRLVIARVVKDGPAHRAGLRLGDELFRVGSLLMADLTPYVADSALHGKPGTEVQIWILRKGWKRPRRFRLTRRQVILPSVESRMLNPSVGIIRVTDFKENTADVFDRHARGLVAKGARALAVDLRDNGGGFVDVAVQMADRFVDEGILLLGEGAHRSASKVWKAQRKTTRYRIPVVVLTNRNSASAAEILAGALKKADRALVLGERTWGKGTVQELEFTSDGGAYKFTTFQYLLAGRVPVQELGVTPDVEVARVSVRPDNFRVFRPEGMDREATVKGHFQAAGSKPAPSGVRPAFTLRMLRDQATDGLVVLARDLLTAAVKLRRQRRPGAHGSAPSVRRALLRAGRKILVRTRAEHARLIAERMRTAGIDWSPRPSGSATDGLRLRARVSTENDTVQAGGKLKVTLTVENIGTRAAYQVGGVLRSKRPFLDGRELVIGRVMPGKARTADVEIRIPRDLVTHTAVVELDLMAGDDPTGLVLGRTVKVLGLPRPDFRFSWQLDDRSEGNGDGILQPGETADLVVVIRNTGARTVDALADCSDPDGPVVLKRARVRLPSFGNGQTVRARLRIALPAGRKPTGGKPAGRKPVGLKAAGPRPHVGLMVTVFDKYLGRRLGQKIRIPVSGSGTKAVPAAGTARPIAADTAVMAAARRDAPVIARAGRSATLKVDARFGKWFRVDLGDGRPGFVPEPEVTFSDAPAESRKPSGAARPRPGTHQRKRSGARPRPGTPQRKRSGAYPPSGTSEQLPRGTDPPVSRQPAPGVSLEYSVKPPDITFEPLPDHIDDDDAVVKGDVSHWDGVKDLWVEVWNLDSDPARRDKILYRAAPAGPDGAALPSRHLAFEVRPNLEKGSNVITVEARNRAGVTAFKRLSIYRPMTCPDAEGIYGDPAAKAPGKAKKPFPRRKSSSRCGCGTEGRSATPVFLAALLAAVGWYYLRRKRKGKRTNATGL